MPIFHDPYDSPPRQSSPRQTSFGGRRTADSPSVEPDTLQLDESRYWCSAGRAIQSKMNPELHESDRKQINLGRLELIERLKRSKSPVWQQGLDIERDQDHGSGSRPSPRDQPASPLLAPAELRPSRMSTPDPLRDLAAAGLEIERPRSALHSGDFRERKQDGSSGADASATPYLATSPVVPWDRSFPTAAYSTQHNETSYSFDTVFGQEPRAVSRARAISQSSGGSFAFLPPTSPLVHAANNPDLDVPSRPSSRQGSRSPDRNNRRHTFSPASFQTYQTTTMARSISGTPAARHLRYGGSIPYQAHQPRRSMTFNQPHSLSSPQSPFLNSRRPSISSEASPLQHAPMVGSYEESILRGRMSTTPSRPLDFVAKIGVLGKGQCKSSLKCPPHVTVPFPAVFYSYNTGNGRISDNEPSPYVGLVDLENSLPAGDQRNESSKRKRRHAVPAPDQDDLDFRISRSTQNTDRDTKDDLRKKEKRKRRSASPKAPPGGSYRIPAQGQLQIVLKNPNNTAVKLFLVPYDLSDMEPGQKTFIRQRSYSAGPIIDMPSQSRKNLGTNRPEAALSNSEDPNDRPILRYLIHLHICCPSKGRYYLYKSIRVVFANRVPDGKEKLRNEIQLPEPRYSTYKPMRDSAAAQHASPQIISDKSNRRRSAAWPLSRPQQTYDQIDGLAQRPNQPPPALKFTGGNSTSSSFNSPLPDLQPIPFSLTRLAAIESRPVSRDHMDIDTKPPFKTPVASPKSGLGSPGTFEKLSRGDVGYGGMASPTSPPSAGLLSQRLRGLEVEGVRDEE
ncbi:hypothetical protein HBI04_140410 [Parastagonospora nodorum]|nr:hypothetical protein HBH47_169700 [Parastagonospora nodorum]KAH4257662.1 hypothetical protein HBI03_154100 [Parastagonospora nodorum]KAH4272899.1 hypothetical protein HBI04_140410 [Parastagonospora nodorum]KAH4932018.1 hypothetical protein HBI79_105330 [Parastagonospora nodorum]KAH5363571.1 hypothetical protein HBI48_080730 [Parastagonospora nodorum]